MRKADKNAVWICTWNDAWVDFDEPHEGLPDTKPVITVGFLVRRTDAVVTLAAERFPEGGYRCLTSIPTSLVQSLRTV